MKAVVRLAWVLAGLVALLPLPPRVLAQDQVASRRMGVLFSDGAPQLNLRALDFADENVRRRLSSGLPQTLVMQVYAYGGSSRRALAVTARSCRVVYDLWAGGYRVTVREGENAPTTQNFTALEPVLSVCLAVENLQVGSVADYAGRRGQTVYFAVLLELNPRSTETVERIRRWLARPTETDGDALFGSFVSQFVNRKVGRAERELRFRSQNVQVPR